MGCRLTKNDSPSVLSDTIAYSRTMSRYNAVNRTGGGGGAADYKARLEWKLCVVKWPFNYLSYSHFYSSWIHVIVILPFHIPLFIILKCLIQNSITPVCHIWRLIILHFRIQGVFEKINLKRLFLMQYSNVLCVCKYMLYLMYVPLTLNV